MRWPTAIETMSFAVTAQKGADVLDRALMIEFGPGAPVFFGLLARAVDGGKTRRRIQSIDLSA